MSSHWEEHYKKGDTPWEKGAPSPGLVDHLASEPVRGRVLVPGCGFGHDVRALAATAEEVIGLDIAASAVDGAQRFPVVGHERYVHGDLFALPPEMRGAFDWVFEHTCFCAIQPSQRAAYVEAVAGALKPGGRLLAVFYLDPGNDSPDEGPPFEVSIAELERLFLPRFTVVREWLPTHAYPGREGREWMRIMRLTSGKPDSDEEPGLQAAIEEALAETEPPRRPSSRPTAQADRETRARGSRAPGAR